MSDLKDSGNRETFTTGAVRDTQDDKPRPGLLSPYAAERKAKIMALGAKKYAARNWEKGMEFSRVVESLERHLIAWKMGKTDEDHLAQMAWNADALLHFDEGVKRGFLPKALDDMPRYEQHAVCNVKELVISTVLGSEVTHKTVAQNYNSDYEYLLSIGCPEKIANHIIGGTTRSNRNVSLAPLWVYLSGPMRGYPEFNFPAFDALRKQYLSHYATCSVISPADIDRCAGDSASDAQTTFCLRDTYALMLVKRHNGRIHLMPGWNKSTGALAEFMIARWLGLMTVTGIDDTMDCTRTCLDSMCRMGV